MATASDTPKQTRARRKAKPAPEAEVEQTPAEPTPDPEPTPPADVPTGAQGFEWPKPAGQVLVDYLKAEVTDAQDAPNRSKPWITDDGRVFLHSSDWRTWLVDHGMAPSKNEAAKPLRDAGLAVKAVPLPGEGRALGFYIGKAPKGTEKLPRRKSQRVSRKDFNPFNALGDAHKSILRAALKGTAVTSDEDKAALAQMIGWADAK